METIGMDCIRRHYGSGPGRHWFDRKAMRFFGTRLPQQAYRNGDSAWFVTSEQPPHGPRGYAVRCYTFSVQDIRTVGSLCDYETRRAADRAARALADAPPASAAAETVADLAQSAADCAAEAAEAAEPCEVSARELELYARNTGEIYPAYLSAVRRLCRLIAAGEYDRAEAAAAFLPFVNAAADLYARTSATAADAPRLFNPETRRACSEALRDGFETEFRANQYEGINPVSADRRGNLPAGER